jgi:hypothetical protein
MSMVGFPLLLIPVAIYNIIAFLMRDLSFDAALITVPLPSGAAWPVTLSDVLLTLGILLLLCEVIKGARPGAKYLMDHLLSLLVLCGAGAEFVLLPRFGTSTYFLLALLALADFLSGLALRTRRGVPATAAVSRREAKSAAPVVAEPQFDPAPAPSVPPAASVAESVRLDHPQPKIIHPEIVHPDVVHPEVVPSEPSPELQPGSNPPPSPDAPR